ncbi:hypothetical protein AN639_07820 [Candidatus Epulonipiscium fishelsonii]|uniref:Uncharacterized protein n=1 Tax=Candidatus Epulonipiscium fishelsonii TaxID=77094 RepID=A0ACC8X8A3_9FIRM|nr:hypothetical protein AN396_11010 [Epulopiscium sp. SCG-B11WGA-EpuloA1]ONI38403.1 hypothetical protein AN639_07820 [Epulopiscium sp. SCG-B05WGA-EpuloA1]
MKILLTAHAGCQDTPLDGLEYIQEAINYNADVIELDVRFNAEGIPVLSHNEITQDKQLVTVEQALEIIYKHNDIKVNYDMKETTFISNLVDVISKTNMTSRGLTTGEPMLDVDIEKLAAIGIEYFNAPVDHTRLDDINYCNELVKQINNYAGINIDYKFLTKEILEIMHENNKKVFVWTVDDKDDITSLKNLGVDSITTNRLDYFRNEKTM